MTETLKKGDTVTAIVPVRYKIGEPLIPVKVEGVFLQHTHNETSKIRVTKQLDHKDKVLISTGTYAIYTKFVTKPNKGANEKCPKN